MIAADNVLLSCVCRILGLSKITLLTTMGQVSCAKRRYYVQIIKVSMFQTIILVLPPSSL